MLIKQRTRLTAGRRPANLRISTINILSLLCLLVLSCSLAAAQDDKGTAAASRKPQTKAEDCAPTDGAQKAASRPSQISGQAAKAETASDESESQDPLASKLRSSVSGMDERDDTLALVDCSKDPDASSAACLKKRAKLDPNQCERTEADNDLKLHSHE